MMMEIGKLVLPGNGVRWEETLSKCREKNTYLPGPDFELQASVSARECRTEGGEGDVPGNPTIQCRD
jgi:hypothetical protein